jgi:hypothetical protein
LPGVSCVVVINSCDKYDDIWMPFFLVFRDFWPSCPFPIVLNTESKIFSLPGLGITCLSLQKKGEKDLWGKRLRETLSHLESEYVIMLFDDYILEAPVREDKIQWCIEWMNANKNISAYFFSNTVGKNIPSSDYPGFELLPQRKDYKHNSSPAIWRRERLIAYTGDSDTPWAWEYFGSARSYYSKELFYCAELGKEDVFVYNYRLGGAIHRGKWVESVIKPVVERYKLDLDLDKRGLENESLDKYTHGLRWRLNFLCTGFKMIGFSSMIFIFRSIGRKLVKVVRQVKP